MALSCQARLSLLQGDLKPAIDWAQSYEIETHAPGMQMWLEIPATTHLRVEVATGPRESLQQAADSLAAFHHSFTGLQSTL